MNWLTLATRELRSLFVSPLSWVLMAAVQGILGWMFVIQLWGFERLAPNLTGVAGAPGLTAIVVAPVTKTAATILLMMAPLVTMRLFAEERRSGTLALLMSAPLSMTEIVLGKFVGALTFFVLVLVGIALMPLSLLAGGELDYGLAAAGFLGLFLLCMSFCSAGLYLSTLTESPPAAAAATLGLLLALWIADWAGAGASTQGLGQVLSYMSITTHLGSLFRGIFDTRDVLYYVLFSAVFLVLSVRRLERLRLVG